MDISLFSTEEFMILHRNWIWAEYIKSQYDSLLKDNSSSFDFKDEKFIGKFLAQPIGAYMCIWYGLLFVVLEMSHHKEIEYKEIKAEVEEIYEGLRRFRNATFHSPKEYFDKRWFEVLSIEDFSRKSRLVHDHIGKMLLLEVDTPQKNNIDGS